MSTKKSALEQALLESREIMKAAETNAKEMLAKELQPEIEKLVKESFEEESDKEDDKEEVLDVDKKDDADDKEETADAVDFEDVTADNTDADSEEKSDVAEIGGEDNNIETPTADDTLGSEESEEGNGEEELDMTGASDEDVLEVFKKLKPEDNIVVTKDENKININVGGEEFVAQLNESEDENVVYEVDLSGFEETVSEEESNDDSIIYEIELDEEELGEGARTHDELRSVRRNPSQVADYATSRIRKGDPRYSLNESEIKKLVESEISKTENTFKEKESKLITENESLKTDLTKHKEALRELRTNLNEVALFNQKLALVNKLFCEHSTSKDEKRNVIKRFDALTTITEAKSLYKVIAEELNGKTTITEQIDSKLNKTTTSASSPETVITESADPMKRIKEVMNYVNKK